MPDRFESVLNGYLRRENMDVYVTGSNAKFLSKDIITEFAGLAPYSATKKQLLLNL